MVCWSLQLFPPQGSIALHRAAWWCKGFTLSAQRETPLKGRPRSTVLLAAGGYVWSEGPPTQFGFSLFLSQMLLPQNLLNSLLSLSIYFPEGQTDTRVTQICTFQTSSSTFSPCCFCNSSRKIKDFISNGISSISTSEVQDWLIVLLQLLICSRYFA